MLAILEDIKNEFVANLEKNAYSFELNAEEKLFNFLCLYIKYLIENKGITLLLFSETTHMNDSQLKKELREIHLTLKEYISRIIKQGRNEGVWDKSLNLENIATLYMGIPISLNIEMVLEPGKVQQEKFCQRMILLIKRVLKEK